jgi:acetoacetyl-CoA synthetase
VTLSWAELAEQVARARRGPSEARSRTGDRVVGYLPNMPETVVAFLACASIGAVWSSCAPEFGAAASSTGSSRSSRHVLLTIDGYRYGDKQLDRQRRGGAIRDRSCRPRGHRRAALPG